jgi:RND family efflux transporter MFP subunit
VAAPKVAGRLEVLSVDVGDRVEPGQLIAVLDSAEYAQQVEQARAELSVAQASREECISSREVARREFERIEALRAQKVASESEADSVQAQFRVQEAKVKVADAQIAQKEAALRAAEVRLSYTRLTAAWDDGGGARVVGERFIDAGAMLTANTPIVSILDISRVKAVFFATERSYPRLEPGQEVTVFPDALAPRAFRGRIERVAPILREDSRQARVEARLENPDWVLRPGMFVRVEVEFALRPEAVVVPLPAVVRRNGGQGLFQVLRDDEGKAVARFVPVTVGVVDGDRAEVLEPADLAGEVVVSGAHLLEDGTPLRLQAAEGAAR